tara:strand:+ start:517 stop:1032 length:516 start_codon:yes stop_codon:yes gene_type:complete
MVLSSVLSLTVIHLTSAKEVNEKTKVMHDAAAIAGVKIGIHKFFNLERNVTPLGSSNNCSSKLGFNVDKTGSQNRIIKAILNQAWEKIKVHHQVDSSVLTSNPYGPVMVKKPIAAIIAGITKGNVRIDLKKGLKGQLYLPKTQATGKPINTVRIVEKNACTKVKAILFCDT